MAASVGSNFLQRVGAVLQRVEYRCASSADDRDLIYRAQNIARPRQHGEREAAQHRRSDEDIDAAMNRYNIMLLLDGAFAGACSIHVGSGETAALPSRIAFGDVVKSLLRSRRLVVDLTEIAIDPEFACKFPELPYLMVRAAWLAAEHFEAEFLTTMCFADQQAAYARSFGFEALCSPRVVAQFDRATVCMALDVSAKKEMIENRFSFFQSTPAERRSIFGSFRLEVADERGYVFGGRSKTRAEFANRFR